MHFHGTFDQSALRAHPIFENHSRGYTEVELVNRACGAVHTALSIAQLTPGGVLNPHLHAYEESFYILSGEAVVMTDGVAHLLGAGDFGVAKVGSSHGVRAVGNGPVRWLQMATPQPKPAGADRDTFFPKDDLVPLSAPRLDMTNLGHCLLGHFDATEPPPVGEQPKTAVGVDGLFLKWLIDENFGARHHRLLFIEYQPGVRLGLHDHAFEEAYLILSGEVELVLNGNTYRGRSGDVFWTGVGCVHSFANAGQQPATWLETFAPQPPKENVFRFVSEWEAKGRELEG